MESWVVHTVPPLHEIAKCIVMGDIAWLESSGDEAHDVAVEGRW